MGRCVRLFQSLEACLSFFFIQLHVWLAGDCVSFQRYPSNTSIIPAEETPDAARRRCKRPPHKSFSGLRAWKEISWHVFSRTVDSCLDTAFPQGGVHGENWPNCASSLTTHFQKHTIHFVKLCLIFASSFFLLSSNGSSLRRGGSCCVL